MNRIEQHNKSEAFGKVFLVGAGPGDPELLTIKAVKILRKADIVFYDDLVSPRILGVCRKKAELVYVGKRLGQLSCRQEDINSKLSRAANEHKIVARLKGGDPSIFGRVGEEYAWLLSHGIHCEIVAGITTASGLASSLGFPLTHRDYASEILFLSGHKKDGKNIEGFKHLNCLGKTLVVYMGLQSLDEIIFQLISAGNAEYTKIAIVQNATLTSEKVFVGDLSSIREIVYVNQVKSPAIMVIGEIVRFYLEMEKLKNSFSLVSHS